ncbi:MAG: PH domain-containing protein [Anaerolineales bacterium]
MNNTRVGHFPPSKQYGLILHGSIVLVLGAVAGLGFVNLARSEVGPYFVIYFLMALLAFAPMPFFGYRAYALYKADYYIDRDSLAMMWGLRVEDIPLTDIEWVRPASDLTHPLVLPRFRLPGSILGTRRHPDLGLVEFIASSSKNLILIATAKRVFAISPKDAAALVRTFARATELGSLMPAEPKSVYPSFIVTQAWENSVARFLWMSGFLLNLGLVIWVGILIPSLSQIPFGFDAYGTPQYVESPVRLILLPLVSASLFAAGLTAGLYFYRWEKTQPLSFIIWISSTICALFFLIAVLFLVTTPV